MKFWWLKLFFSVVFFLFSILGLLGLGIDQKYIIEPYYLDENLTEIQAETLDVLEKNMMIKSVIFFLLFFFSLSYFIYSIKTKFLKQRS